MTRQGHRAPLSKHPAQSGSGRAEPGLKTLPTGARRVASGAHCAFYTHAVLAVIATTESKKANRVSMRGFETLPFHATAAGLAYLAFAPPDRAAKALSLPLTAFKATTARSIPAQATLTDTRHLGYACIDRASEDDVDGIMTPPFGSAQMAVGAVAVATPCHRNTDDQRAVIIAKVTKAAVVLTCRLGNEPPQRYLALLSAA